MTWNSIYHLEDIVQFLNANLDKTVFTVPILYNLIKKADDSYGEFLLPKKGSGERKIMAPSQKLKFTQKCLNKKLQDTFSPGKAAFGFIPNKGDQARTIVEHANLHVGKRYLLNIDLKDFFLSIHFGRIKAVLQLAPFSMPTSGASLVANICCYRGRLPQGAPTSPILSHIVSQRLDRKLVQLARRHRCFYSRYVDDISFSSNRDFYIDDFLAEVRDVVVKEGFKVNDKKIVYRSKFRRQIVTGLVVNEKVNVQRKYLKDIRYWLNKIKIEGYDQADALFKKEKRKYYEATSLNGIPPELKVCLLGKIDFIKQVKGKSDKVYNSHYQKYMELMELSLFPSRIIELEMLDNLNRPFYQRFYMAKYKDYSSSNKTYDFPIRYFRAWQNWKETFYNLKHPEVLKLRNSLYNVFSEFLSKNGLIHIPFLNTKIAETVIPEIKANKKIHLLEKIKEIKRNVVKDGLKTAINPHQDLKDFFENEINLLSVEKSHQFFNAIIAKRLGVSNQDNTQFKGLKIIFNDALEDSNQNFGITYFFIVFRKIDNFSIVFPVTILQIILKKLFFLLSKNTENGQGFVEVICETVNGEVKLSLIAISANWKINKRPLDDQDEVQLLRKFGEVEELKQLSDEVKSLENGVGYYVTMPII